MHGAKPIGPDETEHLVLLARSAQGYAAISRLVTLAQFRGEKDRPVYDWEDLAGAASAGRLVALTGCNRGAVPAAAERGDLEGAMVAASRLRELFGTASTSSCGITACPRTISATICMGEVAGRLGLPVVATNNVHYHDRGDARSPRCWRPSAGGGA